MGYKVLDPKGVAYSDDNGRQVIPCGATLDETLIEKGLFTRECVDGLIKSGRIEGKVLAKALPAAPIESPSNKKAKIPGAKVGRPRKVKK
jgi:hypothetical protein